MGYTISIRYIENPPFQDKGQIRNLQQKLIERATIAVNSQVRIRTTTRTICINQATAPGVNRTPIIVVAEVINDWIGNCLRAASPVDARVSSMRVSTRILTIKLAGMSQPMYLHPTVSENIVHTESGSFEDFASKRYSSSGLQYDLPRCSI
jgi:hypothetical protein